MRQEVVKVLANEESNPAELEAESSAPRSELLAFRQPQLCGHVQKCWRNSLPGRAAGRRTSGKPSPLRDPPRQPGHSGCSVQFCWQKLIITDKISVSNDVRY